jgi:hypothetical protein
LAAWMSYEAGSSGGGGPAQAPIAAISTITSGAPVQRIAGV